MNMRLVWFIVFLGGVVETMWAFTMKLSHGFTVLPYTLATLALLLVSTGLLNVGLKNGIPVGVGYAVWVGIGAIGSVLVGMVVFGDMLSILGYIFLALLIIGIIGMNLVSNEEGPAKTEDQER